MTLEGRAGRRAPRAAVRPALLTLVLLALLAGCGLGPFAGDVGAGDTSASASPGPEVPAPEDPSGGTPEAGTTPTPLLEHETDPNSRVGGLVPGFPADLLPVPEGAEVLVSAVEPIGDSGAYQVSLNLRTTLAASEVVDVYRQSLTRAGFTESDQNPPDAVLAAQTTFTRSGGDELLVIGVLDRDGVRTVTLGGRLRGEA